MRKRKLFQRKFVVLGLISVLIIGLTFPFPNFKHKIQVDAAKKSLDGTAASALKKINNDKVSEKAPAEENNQTQISRDGGNVAKPALDWIDNVTTMQQNNLLGGNANQWNYFYEEEDDIGVLKPLGHISTSGGTEPSVVNNLAGKRIGYLRVVTKKISSPTYGERYLEQLGFHSAPERGVKPVRFVATQTINTNLGQTYQVSRDMGAYSTAIPADLITHVDVLDDKNNSLVTPDFRSDYDGVEQLTFFGTGRPVTFQIEFYEDMGSIGHPEGSGRQVNFPMLVNLDQGVIETNDISDDLFTDSSYSELKLHVVEEDITAADKWLKLILDPEAKDSLTNRMNWAKELLAAADPDFTIEQLVDKVSDEHSTTIIGKTKSPYTQLVFQKNEKQIENPAATMPSDNPRDPTTDVYHIRSDSEGNFKLKLGNGQRFNAGDVLTTQSLIHGKRHTSMMTVADTTPPEKPVLEDNLTSSSTQFEVSSIKEHPLKIGIYNSKGEKVAEHQTSSDDQSTRLKIGIPSEKLPLNAGEQYYAVAVDLSGNLSETSNVVTVKDGTAPKANAIVQILANPESLPSDPRSVLKNVSDNVTSNANLRFEYTERPSEFNMPKGTMYPAKVKITDEAGNAAEILIPIFDKKDEPNLSYGDEYAIYAENATLFPKDMPVDVDSLLLFYDTIARKTSLRAWNLIDGTSANKLGKIPSSDTDRLLINMDQMWNEPGTYPMLYEVTGADHLDLKTRKAFQLTVETGTLDFTSVTANLSYTGIIKSYRQTLPAQENASFSIHDGREMMNSEWKLKARMSTPIRDSQGRGFSGSLIYREYSEGNESKPNDRPLTTEDDVLIKKQSSTSSRDQAVEVKNLDSAGRNVGIMLEVIPGDIRVDEEYRGEIIWTLEDTP
ncbi:toxin Cry1Ac domain D-VI-related protein [Listeria kieliensis]|uniref:Pesticidal crystal protein Cry1Aa domain-containing protein n=1 Tax=Listeria kieliensis TaxID=1621700 RepID=A0A3D8TSS9_9LIST|nr:toxin Cry1Ac domain D-VI-related protein [Listeria kieliensis]RDX02011.1 hypothetical protein UR08_00205 [Listeria kieliensis]